MATSTTEPRQEAGHGGNTGLLLLAAGVVAFGAYELMKGKPAASTTPEPPAGPTLSPPPPVTQATTPATCCQKPGTFVHVVSVPGDPIYVVDNQGALRWIASMATLKACGYNVSPGTLREITAEELSNCTMGPDITGPPCPPACNWDPGTLLVISDMEGGTIAVVDHMGELRHIADPAAFAACGYMLSPANSRQITTADIAGCTWGPPVKGPPCVEMTHP